MPARAVRLFTNGTTLWVQPGDTRERGHTAVLEPVTLSAAGDYAGFDATHLTARSLGG